MKIHIFRSAAVSHKDLYSSRRDSTLFDVEQFSKVMVTNENHVEIDRKRNKQRFFYKILFGL